MTENLQEQLTKAIGWSRNDPRLDQLLHLLSEWQIRNPTVAEARTQLEQNPTLAQLSNLISFEAATVTGGVRIGDVAGGNFVKLVLQQGIFITGHAQKRQDKELRLMALIIDQNGFLHDRLSNFVGRVRELEDLRDSISTMLPTGGFLTITGYAGQGKSSIIAKLVQEYGPEGTTHHFIPFNPGPDHQVALLRNLMAQLILKYDLSDLYVASENRSTLHYYFLKVLGELVAKGGQEVIFLDGLDQLEEEYTGIRDLSFLPNNPPSGVLFVLGTRPDDTLRSIKFLKPYSEYRLPNLSKKDFELILEHRQVKLDRRLSDRFYQMAQKNVLYLNLVAKELMERGGLSPTEIIKHLADDPENLFSLSMDRLKRQRTEWREVIKPVLGLLLAAREPLAKRHIRQILDVDEDRINEGLKRLGGLLAEEGQDKYTLFHLKFRDYLQQNEHNPHKEYIFAIDEGADWHNTLSEWCEKGYVALNGEDAEVIPIDQERREYALRNYITHLYFARAWQRLFDVLNIGVFGQTKIKYDPSMQSYMQDLDLGREASVWQLWSKEKSVELLPHLWRYTLLRCSLNNRGDKYSLAKFEKLISLQRVQEVISLAESLTNLFRKAYVLLRIAVELRRQTDRELESLDLLERAYQVATSIDDSRARVKVLGELGREFAMAQQWERANAVWADAEAVARFIDDKQTRVRVLGVLGLEIARAQQWEWANILWADAEAVARTIENSGVREGLLDELRGHLERAQQWEPTNTLWEEDETTVHTIEEDRMKAGIMREFGLELAKMQQWEQAKAVVYTIQDNRARAEALYELSCELAKMQQWNQIKALAGTIDDVELRIRVLGELGNELAKAQQWEQAKAIWAEAEALARSVFDIEMRIRVLGELCSELAKAQQWEQAVMMAYSIEESWARTRMLDELYREMTKAEQWKWAEFVARSIENNETRIRVLSELGGELAKVQRWEQAKVMWTEAQTLTHSVEEDRARARALHEIACELAKAQQWEQALMVAHAIENNWLESRTLGKLVLQLARAQEWEQAEIIAGTIRDRKTRIEVLGDLVLQLAQAQLWERAEIVTPTIEDRETKARVLSGIGGELVKAQQWERAKTVWIEAEAVIHSIENRWTRSGMLSELVLQLARAQQWEQAETVASTIEEDRVRAKVLRELGCELAKEQQWERVKAVVCAIEDNWSRARVLGELGYELARAQQWEQAKMVWEEAEMITSNIEDNWLRTGMLRELSTQLAKVEQWERAERLARTIKDRDTRIRVLSEIARMWQWQQAEVVARSIEDREIRIRVLSELSSELAKAQQWQRAEVVAHSIEDRTTRARALHELSSELAKAQQWEQAEVVAHSIEDRTTRARALHELARGLARAGKHEQLIHLVQHAWLRADTREYAIRLLPMAIGLIPLKPEIGITFYEAFAWVDNFFKE